MSFLIKFMFFLGFWMISELLFVLVVIWMLNVMLFLVISFCFCGLMVISFKIIEWMWVNCWVLLRLFVKFWFVCVLFGLNLMFVFWSCLLSIFCKIGVNFLVSEFLSCSICMVFVELGLMMLIFDINVFNFVMFWGFDEMIKELLW